MLRKDFLVLIYQGDPSTSELHVGSEVNVVLIQMKIWPTYQCEVIRVNPFFWQIGYEEKRYNQCKLSGRDFNVHTSIVFVW